MTVGIIHNFGGGKHGRVTKGPPMMPQTGQMLTIPNPITRPYPGGGNRIAYGSS